MEIERERAGEEPGAVLVVTDGNARICSDVVRSATAGAPVVEVAVDRTPDDVVDEWHRTAASVPDRFGVVAVGDRTRATSSDARPVVQHVAEASVSAVSNPAAVDEIGLAIMEYLERWSDGVPVVCVDALDALLAAADTETVFRFLHVLTALVRRSGGRLVAAVDRTNCEEETVKTVAALFDAVRDYERRP